MNQARQGSNSRSRSKAAGEGARPTYHASPSMALSHSEEFFHLLYVRGPSVRRQTFNEHLAVLLFQNAVVQQNQQATIMQGSDEASKTLLEGNHRGRNLI